MNFSKQSRFVFLLIIVIGLAITSFFDFSIKKQIQYSSFDVLNKLYPRTAEDSVMIIDIDSESLRKIAPWPWSRDILADMVMKLKAYGVKTTTFNLVFNQPDRTSPHMLAAELNVPADALRNNDQVFADAIMEANNVVMAFDQTNENDDLIEPRIIQPIHISNTDKDRMAKDISSLLGGATSLDAFVKSSKGHGGLSSISSDDGVVRKMPVVFQYNEAIYPAVSLEAIRVASDDRDHLTVQSSTDGYAVKIGDSGLSVPVDHWGNVRLRFRDFDQDRDYISAYKVLDDRYSQEIREKLFEKIILVGSSVDDVRSIKSTPLGNNIPEAEIQANMIEQIIQGDFLFRDDIVAFMMEGLFILCVGLMIVIVSFYVGIFLLTLMTLFFIGGLVVATSTLYVDQGLLFDPFYPSLCVVFTFILSIILNLIRTKNNQSLSSFALGQTLNLTSRLKDQNISYGLNLIFSEDVARDLKEYAVIEIDKIQMKDQTKLTRIYTVLGDEKVAKKTEFRKFRVSHGLFLRDYRRGNFDLASARLQDLMINKYGRELKAYYSTMMHHMERAQVIAEVGSN